MPLLGILFLIGIIAVIRDKSTKKRFIFWFLSLAIILIVFYYFILDWSEFSNIGNIGGILGLSVILALLGTYIQKWVIEIKNPS